MGFKTKFDKAFGFRHHLSVEPLILLNMVALPMVLQIRQEFTFDVLCIHLFPDQQQTCNSGIVTNHTIKTIIEAETTKYLSYYTMIETSFPIILVLLMGPLSDFYGRKWPLIMTQTGSFLGCLVFFIYTTKFLQQITYKNPWLLLLPSIIFSGSGGVGVFFFLVFSYLTDFHRSKGYSAKIVTIKFIATEITNVIASTLAQWFCAFLYKVGGSFSVFLIASGILLSTIGYVMIFIKRKFETNHGWEEAEKQKVSIKLILTKTWTSVTRRRLGNLRKILILCLISCGMSTSTMALNFTLQYVFLKDRLNWTIERFSNFLGYTSPIVIVGSLGIPFLLKGVFTDIQLAAMALILRMASSFVFGMIPYDKPETPLTWVAQALTFMDLVPISVYRATVSRISHEDEVGGLFSLLGCGQYLSFLVFPLIGSEIFDYLLDTRNDTGILFYGSSYVVLSYFLITLYIDHEMHKVELLN